MSNRTRTILVLSIPVLVVLAIIYKAYPYRERLLKGFTEVKGLIGETFELRSKLITDLKAEEVDIQSRNKEVTISIAVSKSDKREEKEIADKVAEIFIASTLGSQFKGLKRTLNVIVVKGFFPFINPQVVLNPFQYEIP